MSRILCYLFSGVLVLALAILVFGNHGTFVAQQLSIPVVQDESKELFAGQKVQPVNNSFTTYTAVALVVPYPSRSSCTITTTQAPEPYAYPVPLDRMIGSATSTTGHNGLYALCQSSAGASQFSPTFVESVPPQYWCERPNTGWSKYAQPTITYQCNQSDPNVYVEYAAKNICSASIQLSAGFEENKQDFYYLCPDPTDPAQGLSISLR